MSDEEPLPVQAVGTSFELLEALGDRGQTGVSELASELGRSKSTVYRHLRTLERQGYVRSEGSEYRPSLKLLRLAAPALDGEPVYPAAKSVVDELAETTGESAAVAAEDGGKAVYLHYSRTDEAVKTDARLGIRLYLHCTGVGKVILAYMPAERRREAIDRHGLPRKTRNTITDRAELDEELARIRERGYAFDDEERLEGMRGVGVPILNRETDELLGGLTVAGPTQRVAGDVFRQDLPEMLQCAAQMVEITLTYE